MIGVAVIEDAAGVVNGLAAAGKPNEGFAQRLAVHEGEFSTAGTVNNLRVSARPVLLDHSAERVIGQVHRIDGDGFSGGVPGVNVVTVVQYVAIAVIGKR